MEKIEWMITMETINFKDCPLSITDQKTRQGSNAQRVAVLVPTDSPYLARVIAVTDVFGTYPATGFLDLCRNVDDPECWIVRDTFQYCPPGRDDAFLDKLKPCSQSTNVKFARWCRNRAFEHAWEAAERKGDVFSASESAIAATRYADRANRKDIDSVSSAGYVYFGYRHWESANAAIRACSMAANAAADAVADATEMDHYELSNESRNAYHRQWIDAWNWLTAHAQKEE